MRSLVLCAALLVPAAAATQTPAPPAPSSRGDNQRVCRTAGEVGSRLATRRLCKTRAEWAEDARLMRATIYDAQTRQVSPTGDQYQPTRPPR